MVKERLNSLKSIKPALFFLFMVYIVVVLRTAWVNEDAYITLRTVDNFIHGYGLRWNIAERVQTFTHPLWFLLISLFYFFTKESFYTLMVLSIVTSLVTFVISALAITKHNFATISIFATLIFSKAFVDFSTSGFENPATHLLLATFLLLFLSTPADDPIKEGRLFTLSLLGGLATLNRMDTILFYLPALVLVFLQSPSIKTAKTLLLGFLPFILWEIFSVIYYGFPFPNTAYAKLATGIPRSQLIEQGIVYFLNSLNWDPITLSVIIGGVGLNLLRGSWKERSIAVGVLLYLSYVLWIGGDYMSGRFLSATLLVGVILLARRFVDVEGSDGVLVGALLVILAFASPTPTLISVSDENYSTGRTDVNDIVDWRSFSFQNSGLLYIRRGYPEPFHEWVFRGLALKKAQRKYLVDGNIGYVGYYAGPQLFIIDSYALCDPLLARLKPIDTLQWQSGHFARAVPDGYIETLKRGSNSFVNKDLGEYYDHLSLIIRGPVFSIERFVTIWKMNTGQYDYLLENYELEQAAPSK